jgi:hypothetical protein
MLAEILRNLVHIVDRVQHLVRFLLGAVLNRDLVLELRFQLRINFVDLLNSRLQALVFL